ncbi:MULTISPECIES: isochorismatase family protein [Burkholderia]|uniref:Isochorismatase n=1 Tax=Burkholderia mayonis TaxID=1385591 RepID=A0A1B4FNX7_9BURK|nr:MULTISPECIES: isochorismatase family protein [Burkholderia]AOJ05377.1 isochorismatase [Burkholderia mayonis]KVE37407.1 isochorismatase [Burkholderia sp. BDU5]KVE47910.1 isochorismatase [Burkholderia mayonis]
MAGIPTIHQYDLPDSNRLPGNTVSWRIDPSRALLLIHDMQNYFLSPFPPTMRETLTANVASLRSRCRQAGIPVAYTAHPGRMTDEERGLLRDFWGPGMETKPADRDVAAAVGPSPGDWIFTKWRYSAFFRTGLRERMRENGRDQLMLCGVYAHIGVLMSAVDAFTNDIQPFFFADGVADFSESHHHQALTYVAQRCGKVLTTKEALS